MCLYDIVGPGSNLYPGANLTPIQFPILNFQFLKHVLHILKPIHLIWTIYKLKTDHFMAKNKEKIIEPLTPSQNYTVCRAG